MAILLYCIAKFGVQASDSLTGVAGDPVVRVEIGSLAAFTSRNSDSSIWMRPRLQASALEFHDVVSEVFKSAAIIPFRFPTIFENEEQLMERLQERSSEYDGLLEKFRDLVQMEIRLTNPDLKKPPESGTQYLKSRQAATRMIEKFTSELRSTLSPLSPDWRERPSKDGLRAFALVERGRVEEFGRIMLNMPVPDGLSVRVSGPWPVSEFIEQS
jgi:Gas vesicle synthesis protein GvpL/GvpF